MIKSVGRLSGMVDTDPARWGRLHRVVGTIREYFLSCGYLPVDTPILEETELFLRKSGGELASKMYTFTDPGGHRVSLRP